MHSFLDEVTPIERVCFNRWDRVKYKLFAIFGKKNRLTWRQILIMSNKNE